MYYIIQYICTGFLYVLSHELSISQYAVLVLLENGCFSDFAGFLGAFVCLRFRAESYNIFKNLKVIFEATVVTHA